MPVQVTDLVTKNKVLSRCAAERRAGRRPPVSMQFAFGRPVVVEIDLGEKYEFTLDADELAVIATDPEIYRGFPEIFS